MTDPNTEFRIKLLEQHLTRLAAKLAVTANKDDVKRQIQAVKAKLREVKKGSA